MPLPLSLILAIGTSIICLLLGLAAQFHVKSTFRRYAQIGSRRGYTGAEAARIMLEKAGVTNCRIERHEGFLSDHYNPLTRTLALSPDVHDGHSLSSIGVACHEAGHALQHAQAYSWLGLRSFLCPVVNICSYAWMAVCIGGMLLGGTNNKTILMIGIVIFALMFLFTLVTLPVEWDASDRARKAMASCNLLSPQELEGASAVLSAAYLTYVASAVSAFLQLLELIIRYVLASRRS